MGNTEEIASSFADCLGGLVSVVGQNLKVQVQALNNVKIKRCLVKSYPVKVDVPKKKHTISVKDLQSEESRDFVFELSVPQIEAEKKEDPLIQLSVQYGNLDDARKVLTTAQEHIKKSRTNQDQFCVDLVKDMQKIQSNMVDRSSYQTAGSKMLRSSGGCHGMQRSCGSRARGARSQRAYRGRGKSAMMNRALRGGK